MDLQSLVNQTRSIMRSRYAEMEREKMGDSDPEALREDLFQQLKTFCPELRREDMPALYRELEEQGHLVLQTNDVVTFSKDFIG